MSFGSLILVVDDDDNLRFLATHQLKTLGYRAIHYATSGREAVNMFKDHHYNLILMDVMMPDMDGFAATAEIRSVELREGRRHTPIIAMTALNEQSKCLDAGMDDYLFKPVLLDALHQRLLVWLPATGAS